jgi:hypothetical protein
MEENKQQLMECARHEVWIKTPFSYIKLGPKLTLFQQDTMLMVSDHLQQYVKNFFDLNLNSTEAKPRALFTKYLLEHGIPPFRINLADMDIDPANYKVVRKAIEEMNLLVEHQEFDENGKPTGHTIFSPVFTKFRVPRTGDYYRKRDEQGEIIVESARHSGYIEVEINKDVAQYAFDMSQGYANHPKLIARYATKRSTPRLYFKLQELMGRERHTRVRLTVQEIKNFLGFETFKDDATGEWVVPYQKFAHFKTKVLDAVKDDLDQMARDNHTDITFTYEPVYLNGRRRGDPDFIEFTIMSTDLGIGYSLLTRKDTPATGQAKDLARQEAVLTEKMQEQLEQCKEYMLAKCTLDNSSRIIKSLAFESWDDDTKTLTLRLSSYKDYQWIIQPNVSGNLVSPALTQFFGKGCCWAYSVPKPAI